MDEERNSVLLFLYTGLDLKLFGRKGKESIALVMSFLAGTNEGKILALGGCRLFDSFVCK